MKLLAKKRIDATQGNILKGIILYAIPLFLSTLIQQCFSAVDLIVLGNLADSTAVAAVGATTTISGLLVNSFVGIASGAKIILSRQFGARDSKSIQKTADTLIITATVLGALIAALSLPFAANFLHMMGCPEECINGASIYLRIYLAASPAILLYNFGSAIITSSGDSQRPMYYIIISGLVNVVLNIVLCLILPAEYAVVAVAVATTASHAVSAFFVIRRLCVMEGDGHIILTKLRFHLRSFTKILSQGLPLALSTALYPLASLQVQSSINAHGVAAIAGSSTGATIESFTVASINGPLASTATVFMGQNIGAMKVDRIKESFWKCLILSVSSTAVLGTVIYLTGEFWLSFFLPGDTEAIRFGMIRLYYVLFFYWIASANGVLSHAIQSFGHASYTAIASICCVFGFRIFWMWAIYPSFENTASSFDMLMLCFLVSWTALLLFNIFGFIFFRYRFYKKILIDGYRV